MTDEKKDKRENNTCIQTRVLYADIDKMGIVYHSNYFRWFEAGRGTYMRKRGQPYVDAEEKGFQLPLVEAGITYHLPARYDDLLTVKTWVQEIGPVQVRFHYEITRSDEVLVRGFTRHATIDREGRLTRLPPELRDALCSEEKSSEEKSSEEKSSEESVQTEDTFF